MNGSTTNGWKHETLLPDDWFLFFLLPIMIGNLGVQGFQPQKRTSEFQVSEEGFYYGN